MKSSLIKTFSLFSLLIVQIYGKPLLLDADYNDNDLVAEESQAFVVASAPDDGTASPSSASDFGFGGFGEGFGRFGRGYGSSPPCKPFSHQHHNYQSSSGSYGSFGPYSGFGPPHSGFGPPHSGFGPPHSGFGPPHSGFGPPHSGYGPPHSGFGPPHSGFGPPHSGFGPPPPHHGFGPPHTRPGFDSLPTPRDPDIPSSPMQTGKPEINLSPTKSSSDPTGFIPKPTEVPVVSNSGPILTHTPTATSVVIAPVPPTKSSMLPVTPLVQIDTSVSSTTTEEPTYDIDVRFGNS